MTKASAVSTSVTPRCGRCCRGRTSSGCAPRVVARQRRAPLVRIVEIDGRQRGAGGTYRKQEHEEQRDLPGAQRRPSVLCCWAWLFSTSAFIACRSALCSSMSGHGTHFGDVARPRQLVANSPIGRCLPAASTTRRRKSSSPPRRSWVMNTTDFDCADQISRARSPSGGGSGCRAPRWAHPSGCSPDRESAFARGPRAFASRRRLVRIAPTESPCSPRRTRQPGLACIFDRAGIGARKLQSRGHDLQQRLRTPAEAPRSKTSALLAFNQPSGSPTARGRTEGCHPRPRGWTWLRSRSTPRDTNSARR